MWRTLSVSEYSASVGWHEEAADGGCNWFQKEIRLAGVLEYAPLTPPKKKLARKGINHHSSPQAATAADSFGKRLATRED
jgi:hypothetical protein